LGQVRKTYESPHLFRGSARVQSGDFINGQAKPKHGRKQRDCLSFSGEAWTRWDMMGRTDMDTEGQGVQRDKGTGVPQAVSTPAEEDSLPLGLIEGCLTVDQAAASAGVTSKTIRRWLESGALSAQMVRRGRARVLQIAPADLEEAVRASGRRKSKSGTEAVPEEAAGHRADELALIRQELAQERELRQHEERERHQQAESVRLILADVRQALEESRAEAHELKAQVSMLQDQVLRALPAPAETIWQRIGRAFGIGRK